jgi:hypothetical protein
MRKLKSKRYLFIGGPSDRKRIPVGDDVGNVYVNVSVDTETLYYSGKHDGIAPTVRHVYHRETYTVDGVETTAFIYDQLWKDRIKLIAHLLANYGKRKKYPRRSKPRIPIDMLYSSINPSDYIIGTIFP